MTTTSPPSLLPPFSRELRDGTAPAHEDAESARFVDALLDGSVPRDGIVDLWAQYRRIYAQLEDTGDHLRRDPTVGRFVVEALRRTPSLDRDLAALAGPGWTSAYPPTPSTDRYVARLAGLRDWPPGFVAHHYTRYLGDLAGGQVIARALSLRADLDGVVLAFPVFDDIPSRPGFRERYRGWLDDTPWTGPERARVVDEARVAFGCNQQLFEDLADRHLPAG